MRTRRESGYSLVEVMAAIVILTTAIIPMVGMFDAALRAVSTSGDYGVARACAGQKLEQLRSLPYETVSAGLPDGTCEPSGFSYAFHEEKKLAKLEDQLAHELMDDVERQELRDRVLLLRRRRLSSMARR